MEKLTVHVLASFPGQVVSKNNARSPTRPGIDCICMGMVRNQKKKSREILRTTHLSKWAMMVLSIASSLSQRAEIDSKET